MDIVITFTLIPHLLVIWRRWVLTREQRASASVSMYPLETTAKYYINNRFGIIHPNAKLIVLQSAFLFHEIKDENNIHDEVFDQLRHVISDVLG